MKIHSFLTLHKKILLIIGAIFGFSSAIVAQYGAPMAHYQVKGIIKSKDCNVPIPMIKVKLTGEQMDNFYAYPVFTDSSGQFVFSFYEDYGINVNNKKIIIEAEDVDGEQNCGQFLKLESEFRLKQISGGNRYDGAFADINIELEYKGKSPCKTELPFDSINIDPPLKKLFILPETLQINPVKSDTISFASTDQSDTLQFQTRSAPTVEFPDNIIVFPNPNEGYFTLQIKSTMTSEIKFEIYDAGLKNVFSESAGPCEGTIQKYFDLSNNAPCTYYLLVSLNEKKYLKKIVKY